MELQILETSQTGSGYFVHSVLSLHIYLMGQMESKPGKPELLDLQENFVGGSLYGRVY